MGGAGALFVGTLNCPFYFNIIKLLFQLQFKLNNNYIIKYKSLKILVIYLYFGELYPINLRGMFFGLTTIIGRVGGILAPELIQLEKENKNDPLLKSIPMITLSLSGFIAGILCLLLPRTEDIPLLQTMTEANELYKKNEEQNGFKKLFQFSN